MEGEATASSAPTSAKIPSFLRRLCRMRSPKQPEKLTLNVQVDPQTPPRLPVSSTSREFEGVFHYFDENGDGKISPAELQSCMRSVGQELSDEDAEAVVGSSDSDGDGMLGFDDFAKLLDAEGDMEEKGRSLREAFEQYQMDGQGCITPKSLKRALKKLGESRTIQECTAMIRRFDLNGDGVLCFDEFRVMML